MAPETTVVSVVVVPAAEQSAAFLGTPDASVGPVQSEGSRREIPPGLAGRCRQEKPVRGWHESSPWEAYATERAEKSLRETERQYTVGWFVRTNHDRAIEFAWRITRDWDLAEQAVSETDLELLTDKTRIQHYYRALKMNARDLLSSREVARARCSSLEVLASPYHEVITRPDGEAQGKVDMVDIPSHRPDDRDPLEILLKREETSQYNRLVQAAMDDSRWRYIKRRGWAQPLAECAESAA